MAVHIGDFIAKLQKGAMRGKLPDTAHDLVLRHTNVQSGETDWTTIEDTIREAADTLKQTGASVSQKNILDFLAGGGGDVDPDTPVDPDDMENDAAAEFLKKEIKERKERAKANERTPKKVRSLTTKSKTTDTEVNVADLDKSSKTTTPAATIPELGPDEIARMLGITNPELALKALDAADTSGVTLPPNVLEHLERTAQTATGTPRGRSTPTPTGKPASTPKTPALIGVMEKDQAATLQKLLADPDSAAAIRKAYAAAKAAGGNDPQAISQHLATSIDQFMDEKAAKAAQAIVEEQQAARAAAGSKFSPKATLARGSKEQVLQLLTGGGKVRTVSGKVANRAGQMGRKLPELTEVGTPEFTTALDEAAAATGKLPSGYTAAQLPKTAAAIAESEMPALAKLTRGLKSNATGALKGAGATAVLALALQLFSKYNENKEERLMEAAHPTRTTADILEDLKVERAMQRRALSEASVAGPQALKLLQSRLPAMTPSEVYIGPRPTE